MEEGSGRSPPAEKKKSYESDCNSERCINRRRQCIVHEGMNDIRILKENTEKVLERLKLGEIERMEFSVEQITDDFMIYGLRGGLIDELSISFPDPRKECEITIRQILSASMAGRFQDMYALSQSPYALHSPKLLAELGLNVKVLCEGECYAKEKGYPDAALRRMRHSQGM